MKWPIFVIISLQLTLSSCFRLVQDQDAIDIENQLNNYAVTKSYKELCSLALNPIYNTGKISYPVNSGKIFLYAADCLRFGYGETESDLSRALEKYQESALCAQEEARSALKELNYKVPEIRYMPGTTFVYNSKPGMCGLSQKLTPVGWVLVFPPMALLALPVGLLLVVAGTVVSIVLIPFS